MAPTSATSSSQLLTLYLYDGAHNLPSLDPECLAVEMYLRFANINHLVATAPYAIPSEQIPLLKYEGDIIYGYQAIIRYLREKHHVNLWKSLNAKEEQRTEALAFTSLIEEKLAPALLYSWWVEDKNFVEIRKNYFKNAMFLARWTFPHLLRRRYKEKLSRYYYISTKKDCLKFAEECFAALEVLLDKKTYFFGIKPTDFDALVYGYLSCILYPALPDSDLQQALLKYKTLTTFCDNITRAYSWVPKPSNLIDLKPTPASQAKAKKEKELTANAKSINNARRWFLGLLGITLIYFVYRNRATFSQVAAILKRPPAPKRLPKPQVATASK